MKSSLLAPKFNQLLTVSLLGLTVLAQPVKTFAQDAVSNMDSVEAAHSSPHQIDANHTKWMIELVNGHEQDYYSVTWGGRSDGNVYAEDLWDDNAQSSTQNRISWREAGDAFSVTSMTAYRGGLYVTANDRLWKRGNLGPGTGNDWSKAGDAFSVTAMASHRGELYVVSNNKLWRRGSLGPSTGNDWREAGDAFGVTAMVSYRGELYVVSNNKLWKRGNLGPGTGNDWSKAGDAAGVTAMASYRGALYLIRNNKLWKFSNPGFSARNYDATAEF